MTPGPAEQDRIESKSRGLLLPQPDLRSRAVMSRKMLTGKGKKRKEKKMLMGDISSLIKIRRTLSPTGEKSFRIHMTFSFYLNPQI